MYTKPRSSVTRISHVCDVREICALLGYHVASCVNCLQTFRDNVSVPSSRVNSPTREDQKSADFNVATCFGYVL